MSADLTAAITSALECLSGAQDVVRHAHGAAQVGSPGLAEVRRDLARRLGRVILDIHPIKAELSSLIVAAQVLQRLEAEESRGRSADPPSRRKQRRSEIPDSS